MPNATFDARNCAHIFIDEFRDALTYSPRSMALRGAAPLRDDYPAHAENLLKQLAAAIAGSGPSAVPLITGQPAGTMVEITTMPPPDGSRRAAMKMPPKLESPGDEIVMLQSERQNDRTEKAIFFIPDRALAALQSRIAGYGAHDLGNRQRPDVNRFEAVEHIDAAAVAKLFVGAARADVAEPRWWELWIREEGDRPRRIADDVAANASAFGFDVHPERLAFPETTVLLMHGSKPALTSFVARLVGIVAEVRFADLSLSPFLAESGGSGIIQSDWIDEAAARISPPGDEAPVVCVLDTGVSASHPLVQPGLVGAWAYDDAWQTYDHHGTSGHGTAMASLSLLGSLEFLMASSSSIALLHAVESMKLLPPPGFPLTKPRHYGTVTQGSVAKVESNRPGRRRSFCLACSSTDFPSSEPSSWSGALDQIAAGSMTIEQAAGTKASLKPKRLMAVATGNVQYGNLDTVLQSAPLEDPSQAWNVLTVGGYTAKEQVGRGLKSVVSANHRSPYSLGSNLQYVDLTPIKPEVLFEAGNMAVDGMGFCSQHDDLSMLAAGANVVTNPLVPFWATSAAAGLAGRFMGRLEASLPGLWPETYRALIVDSARWTQPMLDRFVGRGAKWKTAGKAHMQRLVRQVGFGVPDLDRAILSARNDVSLVAQAEIQPYALAADGRSGKFNDIHFYRLPWPRASLQQLENELVIVKVTLSYFIEPNLTGKAPTRPDTYRSFGLRFEMKKIGMTSEQFRARLSTLEEESAPPSIGDSGHWLLGAKSVQAGSLHCDLWRGRAIDLLPYDEIAIYPVGGWWKSHAGQRRVEDKARYALVISIQAPGHAVDIHTDITNEIEMGSGEIEIRTR